MFEPLSAKTILSPPGDHDGCVSPVTNPERFVTELPSVFIVEICVPPGEPLSNAIFAPSGDQSGARRENGGPPVRLVAAPVARSTTRMSTSLWANAMCIPSGAQVGSLSPGPAVTASAPLPSSFITQICPDRPKAILWPSADQVGAEARVPKGAGISCTSDPLAATVNTGTRRLLKLVYAILPLQIG